jgi:hypothetical protein
MQQKSNSLKNTGNRLRNTTPLSCFGRNEYFYEIMQFFNQLFVALTSNRYLTAIVNEENFFFI